MREDDEGFILEMDVEDAVAMLMSVVLTVAVALLCSFSTDAQVEILAAPAVVLPAIFTWALDSALADRWPSSSV